MASERPIITRDLWQNPSGNLTTVPGVKSLQAAEVLAGFRGSWAGFHGLGPLVYGEAAVSDGSTPAQEQYKAYRLGQPGSPEINFAPFSHYTNRMGSRGGSLVGHPVSFEVVGPTLKSTDLYWQWLVVDNTGTGSGDELRLDVTVANMFNSAGAAYPVVGITLSALYGVTGVQGAAPGRNGLYVVISQTGDPAAVDGNANTGLPDGYVRTRLPIAPLTTTSKMEIFRVVNIENDTTLILDPSKRLADYFSIPLTPACRAITLLEPRAMRLMPLPDSGSKGQETSFLVINPERASRSDLWPKEEDWEGPNTGGLPEDPWKGTMVGIVGDFRECRTPPALPVPRPIRYQVGRVIPQSLQAGIWAGYGQWHLSTDPQGGLATGDDVGKIIHIHEVQVTGDAILRRIASAPPVTGIASEVENKDLLGWYEIVNYGTDAYGYLLRRVPEVDPHTGQIRYGAPDRFVLDAAVTSGNIYLYFTVHEAISSFWRTPPGDYFDIDQVESARLKNNIDPDWVERTLKHPGQSFPGDQARPDKAIFDTSASGSNASGGDRANPGNLLDLGFRMVLYPATLNGNDLVPDFDRPVSSQDVLLNATDVGVKQYIDIDYSNGVIRLSHPVDETSPLYPTNVAVFTHADNPRGELVLFASCVPYSMEPGQLGSGVRVTGLGQDALAGLSCGAAQPSSAQADIYGNRVAFALVDQTITSRQGGVVNNIRLAGDQTAFLPQMGFMEILEGTDPDGEPAFTYTAAAPPRDVRTATFGYYGCAYDGGTLETELYNCYGGGDAVVPDQFVVGPGSPGVAVLRKDIYTPLIPNIWRPGTDYQSDVTFGCAKRNLTLRFDGATLQGNADGSVTVSTNELLALSHQRLWDNVFSSWVLTGCDLTGTIALAGSGDYELPYNAGTILVQGRYVSLPAGTAIIPPASGTYYIYIDGATALASCYPYDYATNLPLLSVQDILIAKAVATAGAPPTVVVTDLRYPLQDIDRRTDIFVGMRVSGGGQEWYPDTTHFPTLWEAVAYANEIQSPTGIGSAKGRALKIRVVGETTEPDAHVPIQIKTDNLVIEGGVDPTGDQAMISWSSVLTCLIDLNGHSDLVFRRLHFNYTDAAGPHDDPRRVVFSNIGGAIPGPGSSAGGLLSRITIEDCYSQGYTQGFIWVGSGGAEDFLAQRNTSIGNMDFGVIFNTVVADAANTKKVRILNNTFRHGDVVGTQSAPVGAGIYMAPSDAGNLVVASLSTYGAGDHFQQGTHCEITGNTVEGDGAAHDFTQGVSIWLLNSEIENNYVTDTVEAGMLCIGSQNKTHHNHITGAWTTGGANKYGLVVAGDGAISEYNEVALDGVTTPADDSTIYYLEVGPYKTDVNGNPNIKSRGNTCTPTDSVIRVAAEHTSLADEHTQYLIITDGFSEVNVNGGWYGNVRPPDGEEFKMVGATLGILEATRGTRVENCYIASLTQGYSKITEDCTIIGCEISFLTGALAGVFTVERSKFEGNTFINAGTLTGNKNLITGNSLNGDMTRNAITGAKTGGEAFRVRGNRNTISNNQVESALDETGLWVGHDGSHSGNIVLGNTCEGHLQVTSIDSSVTANQAKSIYAVIPEGADPAVPATVPAIGNIADWVFGVASPANLGNDHNVVSPL